MLILRSRSAVYEFRVADGVRIDPAGNVVVVEAVTRKDKHDKDVEDERIVAMISPQDFLGLWHDDSVDLKEVPKPGPNN